MHSVPWRNIQQFRCKKEAKPKYAGPSDRATYMSRWHLVKENPDLTELPYAPLPSQYFSQASTFLENATPKVRDLYCTSTFHIRKIEIYHTSTLVQTQHKGDNSARAHPTIFSPTNTPSRLSHIMSARWDGNDMPHLTPASKNNPADHALSTSYITSRLTCEAENVIHLFLPSRPLLNLLALVPRLISSAWRPDHSTHYYRNGVL
jgi:hypothetical protein